MRKLAALVGIFSIGLLVSCL